MPFALPHLGLIRASGPDARAFLQNQLSNDLRQASPAAGLLNGYCSPKGRLLAVLTVMQTGEEEFLLVLPQTLVAATLKRLRMFVLRSKVVLDEAAPWRVGGSLGVSPDAPQAAWQQASRGDAHWLCRPGAARHLVLLPATHAIETDPAAEAAFQLAELDAGLPTVHPETLDHFVPQTANLDLAGGISFGKGCYPGQEIVARVHYLGRLKQRLFLADSASAAAPGADVFAGESAVGEVMDCLPLPPLAAVPSAPRGYRLSLVLNLSAAQAPLRLGSAGGAALTELSPAHETPASPDAAGA